ncbi:hypothetical protein BD310DRAFT_1043694 [Dichomitus squalens]|uniref:Uncharacterized protein n=1 Tax=Dichomitus squalens TaxID=114155 RepID=A0A4Q9PCV9_9APHY|nr:hypothetical protein BD310DRAFT_1043694 [Dichomitus squalens]
MSATACRNRTCAGVGGRDVAGCAGRAEEIRWGIIQASSRMVYLGTRRRGGGTCVIRCLRRGPCAVICGLLSESNAQEMPGRETRTLGVGWKMGVGWKGSWVEGQLGGRAVGWKGSWVKGQLGERRALGGKAVSWKGSVRWWKVGVGWKVCVGGRAVCVAGKSALGGPGWKTGVG